MNMARFVASLALCCVSLGAGAQEQKQDLMEPVFEVGFSKDRLFVAGPKAEDVQALREILVKGSPYQYKKFYFFKVLVRFEGDDQPMQLDCKAGDEPVPDKELLVKNLKQEENPKYSKFRTNQFNFYVKAQRNGVRIRFSGECGSDQFYARLRELGIESSTNGYFDGIAFEVRRDTGIKFLF